MSCEVPHHGCSSGDQCVHLPAHLTHACDLRPRPAGMGLVRRIQLGPPPCPALYPKLFNASGGSSSEILVRAAVTFEGGAFGAFARRGCGCGCLGLARGGRGTLL